jgi:hypothetical protein
MDILDRLNNQLIETNTQVMSAAINEIMALRRAKYRRGDIIKEIFNSDIGEQLSVDLKKRIDAELMGSNVKVRG